MDSTLFDSQANGDAPRPRPGGRRELPPGGPRAGERFGPFELEGEIARGGQGVVFKARHRKLDVPVALKLLLAPNKRAVRRFTQEARVLARLRHPNIPNVVDLGDVEGTPYMAMELIEGRDLGSIVAKRGAPDPVWSARVVETVARAVHFCHEHGVVHRDLKPGNVLIDAEGTVYLVDFGLVRRDPEKLPMRSLDAQTQVSRSGELLGTPCFMAPEQVDAARFGEVGPHTDVYGLAATLFHLLSGRYPFDGTSTFDVLCKVTGDPPLNPAELNPAVPLEIGKVCWQGLAKESDRRAASALAFAQDLRRARKIAQGTAGSPNASDGVRRASAGAPTPAAALGVLVSSSPRHRGSTPRDLLWRLPGNLLLFSLVGSILAASYGNSPSLSGLARLLFLATFSALGFSAADGLETFLRARWRRVVRDRLLIAAIAAQPAWGGVAGALLFSDIIDGEPANLRKLVIFLFLVGFPWAVASFVRQGDRSLPVQLRSAALGAGVPLGVLLGLTVVGRLMRDGSLGDLGNPLGVSAGCLVWTLVLLVGARGVDRLSVALRRAWGRAAARFPLPQRVVAGAVLLAVLAWPLLSLAEAYRTSVLAARGNARAEAGDHAAAVELYSRALAGDPHQAWVLRRRGDAQRELQHLDAALDDYEHALALDPADALAQVGRGKALLARDERQAALAAFGQAIDLGHRDARLYVQRANLLSERDDFAGAIADCSRAIELDPRLAWAYLTRARAQRRTGQPQEGLSDCTRALELAPRYGAALRERGLIHAELGNAAAALTDFDAALALDPRDGWTLLERALLRGEQGDHQAALRDLRRALELKPEPKERQLLEREVRRQEALRERAERQRR